MKIIAGVDEVGRGSLIGPVYASAVILKKSINQKLLKDSKSLSKKEREYLCTYIKKNSTWSVGKASVKEIEKLNILQASLLAMKRAIKKLISFLMALFIASKLACSIFSFSISLTEALPTDQVEFFFIYVHRYSLSFLLNDFESFNNF